MSSIIVQIAEYTKLCKEYSELPRNADTPEEYEPIERRLQELKAKIDIAKAKMDQLKKGW